MRSAFKGRLAAAVALVGLAVLSGSVAVAGASFSAPVNVSGVGAENPSVASDPDGGAIVVWENLGTNRGVYMRTISATGALGTARRLSAADPSAENPEIAIDGDGDAIAVWKRSDGSNNRIEARRISAAGVLGPIQTLSATGQDGFKPQVAIDDDGDAIAVWTRFSGSTIATDIEARRISAAGTLGPVLQLGHVDAQGGALGNPRVAIDADDDAVVAWVGYDEDTFHIVQARTISATGVVGPLRTVSRVGTHSADPQVASNADDGVLIAWDEGAPANRLRARTISAASVLGPVRNVSPARTADFVDRTPRLATDGDGDAVVAWERLHITGPGQLIRARTLSAAGVLGTIQNLSLGGGLWADEPQIASNGNGGAVVIYEQEQFVEGCCYQTRVDARTLSAAGVLGPRQTVQPLTRVIGDPYVPQIASDAGGDATAAWTSAQRVKASHGP